MSDVLVRDLAALLTRAAAAARSEEVRERLDEARARLGGPLRLAVAGKVNAGKSTLLNALLGEELAPTDAGECTTIVTWYSYGRSPRVLVHPRGRPPVVRPWDREKGALEVDLGTLAAGDVERVEVSWPTDQLLELTVLDTPGIASISTEVSERTHRVLAAEDGRVPVADAVLYLMRHTHASDLRFLESFHDDELAHGTPINAIGVLSRADEIGSCRLDAMTVAERIARRYEADRRIQRLCPLVVPVDGLLAQAATSLQEAEYAMLAGVAACSEAVVDEVLLTADRFAVGPTGTLTELERRHLLDRMGLFGVRLSVQLIQRRQVSGVAELARELASRSGLDRLRSVLLRQFLERSRILKARSALAVVTDVLRSGGCRDGAQLGAALEELTMSTHEFAEVRLLGVLRTGAVRLRAERLAELERLLGGSGHDACARLGLEPDAMPASVHAAAVAALEPWRRLAEHPLSTREVQLAAQVATRTLEGLASAAWPR